MSARALKTGWFVVEGLNSFATTLYFYYFYFFTQQQFGYGSKVNLALAALNGLLYALAAWTGGRFAQRFGYIPALKLGLVVMAAAMGLGLGVGSAAAHVGVMAMTVVGACFTWPALEALVSEGETRAGLQHCVGLYNVVWAGTGALAYFVGGAILDRAGLASLFWVPLAVQLGQLGLTIALERATPGQANRATSPGDGPAQEPVVPQAPADQKVFLRMAWLANPFAYIAINTLVAVMPDVAGRLGLTTTQAGFCAAVWCFARLGAFGWLWYWPGWHYRFGWLLAAFVTLLATFGVILMVPHLATLLAAQVAFGGAIGLIYYSSLFYSMDAGDTKGEHGGIHEAAIGLGNCAGPALGAVSLHFFPTQSGNGATAVSLLLCCGLAGLLLVRRAGRT